MELPGQKDKKEYLLKINTLSAELESAVDSHSIKQSVPAIQKKLDQLATRYENDELIGRLRYKLYELQAIIHYFQRNDESAREFIDHAINIYGSSYPKAERLIAQLQPQAVNQNTHNTAKYFGIKGWLMVYVVGLVLAILFAIFNLLTYANDFKELETLRYDLPGFYNDLGAAMWVEITFAVLAVILAVSALVQIMRYKKSGSTLAITYMITLLVTTLIIYSIGSSIASNHSQLDLEDMTNSLAVDFGRNIIYAAIWIPYFASSKRVKATLIK